MPDPTHCPECGSVRTPGDTCLGCWFDAEVPTMREECPEPEWKSGQSLDLIGVPPMPGPNAATAPTAFIPRRMTGMCRNGSERDSGRLYHAVPKADQGWGTALCGAIPGRRGNGWDWQPITETTVVTCPRCLRRLARQKKE